MAVPCNFQSKLSLTGNFSENWNRFKQPLEIYLLANSLDDKDEKRKIAIFLHVVGEDGLDVYNTFKFTEEKSLQTVLDKFTEYCNLKKILYILDFYFTSDGKRFNSFLYQNENTSKRL